VHIDSKEFSMQPYFSHPQRPATLPLPRTGKEPNKDSTEAGPVPLDEDKLMKISGGVRDPLPHNNW